MVNPKALENSVASFQRLLINTMAFKPECVHPDMLSAAPTAITAFKNCLMNPDEVKARAEQEQKKFEALLDQLRKADAELAQTTDPVLKAQKLALVEIELIGGFFMEMTHDIFSNITPVLTCTEETAANFRQKLLSYIDELGKCYA